MGGRTLFNFRVLRCPSCSATLPVKPDDTMVVCEYCDAHVQVARSKADVPPPAAKAPTWQPPAGLHHTGHTEVSRYVAKPRASAFAWTLFSLVLTLGIGAVVFGVVAQRFERFGIWEKLSALKAAAEGSRDAPAKTAQPIAKPVSPKRTKARRSPGRRAEPSAAGEGESKSKGKGKGEGDETEVAKVQLATGTTAPAGKGSKTSRPAKAVALTGPVLSSSEARKALEGGVLECMRAQGVHDLLGYMGNSKVGPVRVLADSRARIDGVRAKLKGSKLGRCMDKAAQTTRVRAFKSDYVRFALVNSAVPDPLGHLPAKSDRKAIVAIIDGARDRVLECARKHGEEGAREVFYFVIDGPEGRARSVRGSYRSKAFQRCAVAIYSKLEFPKVREWDIKVTKNLRM